MSQPGSGNEAHTHMQAWAWRVGIPLQATDARDYFLQSGPTRPQRAC